MSITHPSQEDVDAFYDQISQKIKQLRQAKGISQLDMALILGQHSSAFYANAENRKHGKHFNLEHLLKLATALEVEVCELLC